MVTLTMALGGGWVSDRLGVRRALPEPGHPGPEPLPVRGLEDRAHHVLGDANGVRARREGRDDLPLPDRVQQLKAVHSGHPHVAQGDVVLAAHELGEGGGAVCGRARGVALTTQPALSCGPDPLFVIDHEDSQFAHALCSLLQ